MNGERVDLENWLKSELSLHAPDRVRIAELCRRYVVLHDASRAPTQRGLEPIDVTLEEGETP